MGAGRGSEGRGARWLAAALVLGLLAALALPRPLAARGGDGPADAQAMRRHALQVTGWMTTLEHVLGPLGPVAVTPFFGLAALTGAALLAESEWAARSKLPFVAGLKRHALLGEVRRYGSWPLFGLLLALAVLTYLANSGKLQGSVGKLLRAVEDSSVLLGYTLLALAALAARARTDTVPVAEMGIGGTAGGVVLAAMVGLALGFLMLVRFALDVLIWLSPVPFIDLLFESLKKLIAIGLVLLLAWSPVAAAAVSLGLVLVALVVAGWARRTVRFAFSVLLEPLFARLVPSLATTLREPRLVAKLQGPARDASVVTRATALQVRGARKRSPGVLVGGSEGICFWTLPVLRQPRRLAVGAPGLELVLARTLLWLELRVLDGRGKVVSRVALSRTLGPRAAELRVLIGAADGGTLGAARILEMAQGTPGVERAAAGGSPSPGGGGA